MSIQDQPSESELIHHLQKGDKAAFVYIYEQYWSILFNQAYKRLPQQEIVKELIQDLFMELWQKRNSLNIHTSLSAYLHNALKHKVFNHYKSEIIREKHAVSVKNTSSRLYNEVEESIFFDELSMALKKEIAGLPLQPKQVYLLKHEQGLNYAEIAKALNISVSTVEKHMIKALKIIRKNLKGYAMCLSLLLGQL